MKSLGFLAALLVTGALLTGCASVAHVEKDETVNFSNYKTYSWTKNAEGTGKKAMELRRQWWEEGTKEGWIFLFYHDVKTPVTINR